MGNAGKHRRRTSRLDRCIQRSHAAQAQSLAQYGEAALNAFGEIENNLDNGTVVAQREAELTEASKQANEAFRIANLRYNAGESELLDVLSIQQRVVGAQRSLSSVKRLLLEQRVNLNLALGGDWRS
ncbi:MAG: TolC family protein [Candidatus Azotimanducaceae bacterium WSBS_2022_MAG_OTU7]